MPEPFSREEIARYSRHLLLPEVSLEGQARLKAGSVLVVGAGGLGSPAALYLAAAGVGTIGLADFDAVDARTSSDRSSTRPRRWAGRSSRVRASGSPPSIRTSASRFSRSA